MLLTAADIKVLDIIVRNQTNNKVTFARNNFVFVWDTSESLARQAKITQRTWFTSVHRLVTGGLLIIERSDFTFNKTTNAYRIDYSTLPEAQASFKKHNAMLDAAKAGNPSLGLTLIAKYKKTPGKYQFRKGVIDHHRKRQRETFLRENGLNEPLFTTQGLPPVVYSNLLSLENVGLEGGRFSNGHLMWAAAQGFVDLCRVSATEKVRKKLPTKVTAAIVRWVSAAFKKGLLIMANLEEFARWVARSKRFCWSIELALSFKCLNVFNKFKKGCYNTKYNKEVKEERVVVTVEAKPLCPIAECEKAKDIIATKSASQEETNLWWHILTKVGPVSFVSWFSKARLIGNKKIIFDSAFEQNYCERNFLFKVGDDIQFLKKNE